MSGHRTEFPLVLVLAMAENGVIGHEGRLPWRIKSDMAHFKAVTMGKPVIMGRKTWDSLPRALPGRDNIIVSRNAGFTAEGGQVVSSLDAAVVLAEDLAMTNGAGEICVIGGAEIYRAALALAGRVELTEIHFEASGATVMSRFSATDWEETARERHKAAPGETSDYSFVTLKRRGGGQAG